MEQPRRKRARRCARGMVADGTAGAASGFATAPQPPTLLSLPDETLAELFALLSERPGVALGWGTRDAHALAAAHPRLHRLFRCEVVTRLELQVSSEFGRHMHLVASRALQRHPRATALALDGHCSHYPYPRVYIVPCAAPQLTVIDLAEVTLREGGCVLALLARCRGLEELRLFDCRPKLGVGELDALVSAAGPRLRVLSLWESADNMTDVGGAQLRDLTALTELELSGFRAVGEATLLAAAALPALASLSLRRTDFSDECVAATLPRMTALRKLDVSYCYAVGPPLWAALPPTLRVLRADGTALLAEAPGDACEAALAELHVEKPRIVSWAALAGPHVSALRVLNLSDARELGDAGAAAALEAMPQLEALNLFYCIFVGYETATAIARHEQLRFVDMSGVA